MNTRSEIGFFGKIPSHGDFVRRRFPAELFEHWDDWLQSGLAASRGQLGDDWLTCYLSGPIWRFCLSAGLCGQSQWTGAMMPSVDRVGRYFPLSVMSKIPANYPMFGVAISAENWFQDVESAMLSTLIEDGVDAEQLSVQLDKIGPLALETPRDCAAEQSIPQDVDHVAAKLSDAVNLGEAEHVLIAKLADRVWGNRFSLWWSNGSEFVVPDARIYGGLPSAATFWTLYSQTLHA